MREKWARQREKNVRWARASGFCCVACFDDRDTLHHRHFGEFAPQDGMCGWCVCRFGRWLKHERWKEEEEARDRYAANLGRLSQRERARRPHFNWRTLHSEFYFGDDDDPVNKAGICVSCDQSESFCADGWWKFLAPDGHHYWGCDEIGPFRFSEETSVETLREQWIAFERKARSPRRSQQKPSVAISNSEARAIAAAVYDLGLIKPGELKWNNPKSHP